MALVEITVFRLESKCCKGFFFIKINCPPVRALKFITGHVIYNLAYIYKFQLKTTTVMQTELKCEKCDFTFKSPFYMHQHFEQGYYIQIGLRMISRLAGILFAIQKRSVKNNTICFVLTLPLKLRRSILKWLSALLSIRSQFPFGISNWRSRFRD